MRNLLLALSAIIVPMCVIMTVNALTKGSHPVSVAILATITLLSALMCKLLHDERRTKAGT